MEIVFLGTAGAIPTEKRNLPAIFLNYMGEYFLFDCGEGTQRQMRMAGINFMRINNVFITHLHADHFMGLVGLIQSMDFLERKRTLEIYGPQGLARTVEHMLSLGTFKPDSLEIQVHEISEGVILKGERYAISCARTEHTKGSLAYCFQEDAKRKFLKEKALSLGIPEGRLFSRLQKGETVEYKGKTYKADQVLSDPVPGRKIVYTGDTRACKSVLDLSRDADVLIHDGTYSIEDKESLEKSDHSTVTQAAETAKKAKVKKLYLTHISQRYPDPKPLQEEARKVFAESYVAEDFMKVKVKKHE
ncbi:MAG: ribonuclease Z [Candidatus Altiarchaeota archaeon]|nr:ribonuclease Z [Candidatus Altiarchaeota archaeon]